MYQRRRRVKVTAINGDKMLDRDHIVDRDITICHHICRPLEGMTLKQIIEVIIGKGDVIIEVNEGDHQDQEILEKEVIGEAQDDQKRY